MTGIILPPNSSEPLYRQVRHALESALVEGRFRSGPLPSSRALALELGVSRNTVNLAYQELVAEGLIVSEERVGYRANVLLVGQSQSDGAHSAQKASTSIDWSTKIRPMRLGQFLEIEKDSNWREYPYPFIYGQVRSSEFPISAWNRALRSSMDYPHVHASLRDAGSRDDPLLIEQLRDVVLSSRGIRAAPEEILITLGAQNGLFLAARSLVNEGDETVIESPGYTDGAHIFAAAGAKLSMVPVDRDGLQVEHINESAKFISVTPSHQFPTNVSLSQERRERLLSHAQQSDAIIFEDDYDSEFRYVGQPAPALRAVDRDRVVYVGSFSKFLAPGLRLGYVVASPELIARMRHERRYSFRHPPGQIQRALALMIANGDYNRVLRKYRLSLRDKWTIMNSALTKIIGPDFQPPTGGTSMWVPLPDGVRSDQVCREAAGRGVLIESGATFYTLNHPEAQRFIRIGYSAISRESIEPGLAELAAVIDQQRVL